MTFPIKVSEKHRKTYEHVLEHLRKKHIRITETRKAIVAYMIEAHHHPSAETIYQELKSQYTHMSLATVYNNLKVLVEEGFVSELKVSNDNTTYFDFMGHEHLNIVCERCGKITDFFDLDVSHLEHEAEETTGYAVTKTQFMMYGICPDCSKK